MRARKWEGGQGSCRAPKVRRSLTLPANLFEYDHFSRCPELSSMQGVEIQTGCYLLAKAISAIPVGGFVFCRV